MSGPAMSGTSMSWPEVIGALMRREDLPADAAGAAMDQIMIGAATQSQIAGFAVALRAKGETVDEVGALVGAMLRHAQTIEVPGRQLDVVGTGGDGAHTVNISTMSAIVAAAAGAAVVKHGNRAASSSCGSADLLEALGIPLDLTPDQVVQVAAEVGITFCFARAFHPALRHAGPVRAELGVPTTFNFLGPLANPAQPQAMALGVADPRMAPIMAGVLAARGVSALVFRGEDGLDELSLGAPSRVWVVRDGSVAEETVDAVELGLARADAGALRGGDAAHNAGVARALLAGESGPVRDAVLLNSAAALSAYEPNDAPLADQLTAGIKRAAEAIDGGAASTLLDRWVAATRQFAGS